MKFKFTKRQIAVNFRGGTHRVGVPDYAWKEGRQLRQPRGEVVFPRRPQRGNPNQVYITQLPLGIPLDSELYQAYTEMPRTRQGIRFNPWSLFLEILDDPRLHFNLTNGPSRRLLTAIGYLSNIYPSNLPSQRPLFTQYLFRSQCLTTKSANDVVEITPSEQMVLHQMQWPRFITAKYQQKLTADTDDWYRPWLVTNLCQLELRSLFIQQRTLYGRRIDRRQQIQWLIRHSFDSAPGLALNALLCWQGHYSELLNPYQSRHLTDGLFSDPSVFRQTICQAWSLYHHLVLDPTRSCHSKMLFDGLCQYDPWHEIRQCLQHNVALDPSLINRCIRLQKKKKAS